MLLLGEKSKSEFVFAFLKIFEQMDDEPGRHRRLETVADPRCRPGVIAATTNKDPSYCQPQRRLVWLAGDDNITCKPLVMNMPFPSSVLG